MITLNIEDKNVENIFLNEFNSNQEKFFEFIKLSFDELIVKDKESLSHLQKKIDEGFASGDSGQTVEEVFKNYISIGKIINSKQNYEERK